eukprot:8303626-Alexandrium_andersonii.AAC.1
MVGDARHWEGAHGHQLAASTTDQATRGSGLGAGNERGRHRRRHRPRHAKLAVVRRLPIEVAQDN